MKKFIHTADWHLGQSLSEYERIDEHKLFLDWLAKQVCDKHVDGLLIAGDIFDNSNPSVKALKMYYEFLTEIKKINSELQIIIIAGNHDSASRLEASNPFTDWLNISVCGSVSRTENGEIDYDKLIVPLTGGGYCLAVPYLRQGEYPDADTYEDGVKAMYKELYSRVAEKDVPIIAMGHLHASGSVVSDDIRAERVIVGGIEGVPNDAFLKEFTYTALGHLHRNQKVGGRDNLRYSGSPIPMSFSERNYKQGVNLVTINDDNSVDVEQLVFDDLVKLIMIECNVNDLFNEIEKLPDGDKTSLSPILKIKIKLNEPDLTLRFKIEEALKCKAVRLGAMVRDWNETSHADVSKLKTKEELYNLEPLKIADKFYKSKYPGSEMRDDVLNKLKGVIKEVQTNNE